jgi:hypothetical protein
MTLARALGIRRQYFPSVAGPGILDDLERVRAVGLDTQATHDDVASRPGYLDAARAHEIRFETLRDARRQVLSLWRRMASCTSSWKSDVRSVWLFQKCLGRELVGVRPLGLEVGIAEGDRRP